MGILWDIEDFLVGNIIKPVGDFVGKSADALGRGIDTVVTTVVIDGVAQGLDDAVDFVKENPGKAAAIVTATVVTGGVACVAAPAIATAAGGAGLLGTTAAGVAIDTLSGAALTNASLAAIGGGSIASGGGGIVAGTVAIAKTGAAIGAVASTGVAAVTQDENSATQDENSATQDS